MNNDFLTGKHDADEGMPLGRCWAGTVRCSTLRGCDGENMHVAGNKWWAEWERALLANGRRQGMCECNAVGACGSTFHRPDRMCVSSSRSSQGLTSCWKLASFQLQEVVLSCVNPPKPLHAKWGSMWVKRAAGPWMFNMLHPTLNEFLVVLIKYPSIWTPC